MWGIHRHDQGKRSIRCAAVRADELDGLAGLILRSPLVYIIKAVPRGSRVPVHGMQVVVVGAVGNPGLETVPPFRGTPLVPGYLSLIVVGIYIRRIRGVQVPFSDVSGSISCLLQHVTPADSIGRQFHSVRTVLRIAVARNPVGNGIHPRHPHGPGRRRNRIVADSIGKEDSFRSQAVQVRGLDRFLLHTPQGISPELVGHDKDQIGPAGR